MVERYAYDPYGLVSYLDRDWSAVASTAFDVRYLYRGGRWFAGDQLYHFPSGSYEPALGPSAQLRPKHEPGYHPGQVLNDGGGWGVLQTTSAATTLVAAAVAFPVLAPVIVGAGIIGLGYQAYGGYRQGGVSGALANVSGVAPIYEAWTNESWFDGSELHRSDSQRAALGTGGILQLAGLAYGSSRLGGQVAGMARRLFASAPRTAVTVEARAAVSHGWFYDDSFGPGARFVGSVPRTAPRTVSLNVLSRKFTPNTATLNKLTAFSFYTREGGFAPKRAIDHMKGIDFSQPVRVVDLPENTVLQQYYLPRRGIGNYFAPPGTTPLRAGLTLEGQSLGYFRNTVPVRALQSVAAPDYIYPPGAVVPGSGAGGGVQYFVPNKGVFVPAPR